MKQESLNACVGSGCTTYLQTLENVKVIYAFVSCKDDTLPYHTLVTGQQTLGRPTNWNEISLFYEALQLFHYAP